MVDLAALPEPRPQTIFARGWREAVGSSGAGKALNLRRLGVDVTLWAALGADAAGEHVRTALAGAGVELIAHHDPAGTMRHLNLMDPAGDRVSIFLQSSSPNLDVDHSVVTGALAGADVVFVTIFDHCRGFLPIVASASKERWIDIHDYDGHEEYHREFVDAADVLFVSDIRLDDPAGFMRACVDRGTRLVVCTRGARGAVALGRDEGWCAVDPVPVPELVDSNGAGDAFSAAFAVAWHQGLGLEAAMRAGALMGAAAVASAGLAPESCPDELQGLLG